MIEHINPETVATSPHYDQATILRGPVLVIGGQNGVDTDGALREGAPAQAEQAMRNVLAILADVGADQESVGRLAIQIVQGADLQAAAGAAMQVWGTHRTAVVVSVVAGLARPGALVEIDALAALSE